jgi:hypothetical protein
MRRRDRETRSIHIVLVVLIDSSSMVQGGRQCSTRPLRSVRVAFGSLLSGTLGNSSVDAVMIYSTRERVLGQHMARTK